MSDDLFSTPTEEINRLAAELRETKEALRELSGNLARIETRLKRAFPQVFSKTSGGSKQGAAAALGPTTLTAESARTLYEELVDEARKSSFETVRQHLMALSVPDLSFLRRELGASLGKKKPSTKVLVDAILSRIRESVMLSKHTNRQELLDQSGSLDSAKSQPTPASFALDDSHEPVASFVRDELAKNATLSELEAADRAKKRFPNYDATTVESVTHFVFYRRKR